MKVMIINGQPCKVEEITLEEYKRIEADFKKQEKAKAEIEENKQKELALKFGAINESISKLSNKLETLVKSHFITVFSLFELKALKGEIEVEDENLLNLDEKVLNNEVSVEFALNSHEYLKTTYEALFGKVGE